MSRLWNVPPDDRAAWKCRDGAGAGGGEAVVGGSGWVVSRCVNISLSYMFITLTGQDTGRELLIEAGISTVKRRIRGHPGGNLKWPYVRYEARKRR